MPAATLLLGEPLSPRSLAGARRARGQEQNLHRDIYFLSFLYISMAHRLVFLLSTLAAGGLRLSSIRADTQGHCFTSLSSSNNYDSLLTPTISCLSSEKDVDVRGPGSHLPFPSLSLSSSTSRTPTVVQSCHSRGRDTCCCHLNHQPHSPDFSPPLHPCLQRYAQANTSRIHPSLSLSLPLSPCHSLSMRNPYSRQHLSNTSLSHTLSVCLSVSSAPPSPTNTHPSTALFSMAKVSWYLFKMQRFP